ncbi:EF-P lysine aminoacylase GenX [Patescibacteria group bacterium]|nr:EF-P lysine aminoacylase GenX [Patescibacteria group bacterium]MBU1674003.1 EF-P lysine aminoacylase GenX [Patescibacteria group bacterium]MBU1962924.1 EF-P lysine aminoacylase GenX [Patescibacteria group bacterium]
MTPEQKSSKSGSKKSNKFEQRADIIDAIRAFFKNEGFLEVDTPCLVDLPGMEPYLDPLKTEKINGRGNKKDAYLITSPEYAMKKLLVDGFKRIYTICSCFRNGETPSSLHNTEFKMLEWYRADADYKDIMKDTENLIYFVNKKINNSDFLEYQGKKIDLTPPWSRKNHTGDEIDEHLGWEKPEFIIDYPAAEASLSKINKEDKAERFELFIAGIELGNAFSELTDWQEQEKRLIREREERIKMEKIMYPVDNTFIEALKCGMPESGGIALGVDRLVMLLTNSRSLKEVILFPDD